MEDIARFLREHEPFREVDEATLARVAAAAEIEFHPAGETIVGQGEGPDEHVTIVRAGAVELADQGRVLDLLGEGELFGHPSMLSGLPAGFTVRAHEDTLCLRLPGGLVRPLLARPAGLRFVARSILERPGRAGRPAVAAEPRADPVHGRVDALMSADPVVLGPDVGIREAARRMTDAGSTCVIVRHAAGLGIMTDRDLRSRVVAGGLPADASVSAAMTAHAHTVAPDRPGTDALLDMLDLGVHHLPVVSSAGAVVGVVSSDDLIAVGARTPFHLRASIARARDAAELAEAMRRLRPAVVALHEAQVVPEQIGAVVATVVDALTRRLLDLEVAALGPPPAPLCWLVLGSLGRREGVPSSDVDSAIVWHGEDDDPEIRAYVGELTKNVMAGLEASRLPACPQGAVASKPLFARSAGAWRKAIASWLEDPTQDQALILVSVVVDGRPLWNSDGDPPAPPAPPEPLAVTAGDAAAHPSLLRLLARFALSHRPPTGFLRDFVVDHTGDHRGQLDIKAGGLLPVVDLARYAGMAAGIVAAPTRDRLRAAAEAGTLSASDARTLEEAFDLCFGLRLEHQVAQLRDGLEPDDFVDPRELNGLTRRYLREAFRAVAGVQRAIGSELELRLR